jgi:probable F420-dependent oxidoreductase
VKFGVHIMGVSLKSLGQVARAYEEHGIESAWVPEHLVFPATMPPEYPYSDSGYPPVVSETPAYDPWVLLASLAAVTSTIRLATNIYILPLRHPLQTARSVVTLDRVSGGRVTLGIGVGWLSDEYDYLGLDFSARGRRADAIIEALRRLWADDVIEIHNEHFSFGPVVFQPKPLQKPSIPIEVGGASPAALRRAGALGDGWIEIGCGSLEEFKAKLAVVMEARRRAGRADEPFEVTTSGGLGGPGLDGYRRMRDAGATRLLVGPPRDGATGRLTPESCVEWAERFHSEVIDRLD